MSLKNKAFNTTFVFGASCVAPSVYALNAMAGAGALAATFTAASAALIAAGPLRKKAMKPFKPLTEPAKNTWIGRNFFKAAALGTAAILGGSAALSTYDDMANEGKDFSVAFTDNVTRPGYTMARYGIMEGLVPLGRLTTKAINNTLEWGTGYEMPTMKADPDFNEYSSFRARCIEPSLKLFLDGGGEALDNYFMGDRTGKNGYDREFTDTMSLNKHVHYDHRPICW